MTDKRVDIEVVDKVAPQIDDKLLQIAKSARIAYDALAEVEKVMGLIGASSGKEALNAMERLSLAEAKAALAASKMNTEVARQELLHAKTTAIINKETEAVAKLANANAKELASALLQKTKAEEQSIKNAQRLASALLEQTKAEEAAAAASEKAAAKQITKDKAAAVKAQAIAAKEASAELNSLTARANALKAVLDPLSAAQKIHTANLAEYDTLLSRNLITTSEHTKLVDSSKAAYDRAAKSIAVMGNSATLSAFQVQNLSYQVQDIIVGLYSGQNPLTVFIQQGLQIQQIFGQQGLGAALKGVADYLRGFFTVARVGVGGLLAAAGAGISAFDSYISAQKEVAARLQGLGAYAGITARQFDALANSVAKNAGISVSSAEDLTSALIASGNATSENLLLAGSNVKNFAATFRTDIAGATNILTDLFANPEQGITKLTDALKFADVATKKEIQNLIEQGRAQDALTLGLQKAIPSLVDAKAVTTGWSRAWDEVTVSVSNYWRAFGKVIDQAIYGKQEMKFPDGINAAYNKLASQAQELVGKYDQWSESIRHAGNALSLIDSAIDKTKEKLAGTFDETERANLQKFIVELTRTRDIYDYMGASLQLFGDATTRAARSQALELQAINATTAGQRARIAKEQELIKLAGQGVPFLEAKNAAEFAYNSIITQRNKLVNDELYSLREENKLVGLVGVQREVESQLLSTIIAKRQSGNALSQKEIDTYRQLLTVKAQNALKDQALNSIYDDSVGKIQKYMYELEATNLAYAKGWINSENYALRLNKISLAVSDLRLKMGNGNFVDATNVALGKMVSGYEGVLPGLSNSFGDFFVSVQNGFADSIGRAIVMSEDLNSALKNVAQTALSQLISALIKLGIQYAVNAALGQSVATAATAATAAQAALVAQAWAPAAAMASLATGGANAAGATGALASVTALAQSLALAIPGFASGGPVSGPGTGTSDSILALLSNGEFVVNAKASNDNAPLLNHINKGGRANDIVGKSATVNINVVNNSSANIRVERLSETDIRIIAEEEANRALNKNGDQLVSTHISNPNSKTSRALGTHLTAARRR